MEKFMYNEGLYFLAHQALILYDFLHRLAPQAVTIDLNKM
jgi:hypothetical protein